jgi:tetraacyldisaccharide 4'-kinase
LLDRLYGSVALAKRRWMERHPSSRRRLARPVVSVGNLSVGGTGKTPVVAALATWLVEQGERPAILSRGYKRRRVSEGVVVVSDGTRELVGVDDAGDEPLMLARQVPGAVVCVGADRYLSGVLAERRFGCTVHLLDDGFQHLGLARDLDVLVTAVGEIPQGRVLPAGRLREPMAAAARADLLIVSDTTVASAQSEAWALGISQSAVMTRRLGVPRWLNRSASFGLGDPVVAVAGIAHPTRFFDALHASGFNVARTLPFGDHHLFTSRDLGTIDGTFRDSGATAVVTTEKDAARLGALQPLPFPLAVVPLEIEIEPWADVAAAVAAALARRRGDSSTEARGAKVDA